MPEPLPPAAPREPAVAGKAGLDRCQSEKTVDTAASLSRGGSRSSLCSRTSSRWNGSSRSVGSHTGRRCGEDGPAARRREAPGGGGDAAGAGEAAADTPERRVRRVGYSEDDRSLLECLASRPSQAHEERPNRVRRIFSWAARPAAAAAAAAASPRADPSDRIQALNGEGTTGTPRIAATRRERSRSAVFVKTPNGVTEGILYR